jgi:polysaccharide biosynthesis transport protein
MPPDQAPADTAAKKMFEAVDPGEHSVWFYFEMVLRRKWILIAVTSSALAIAGFQISRKPPVYQSTTTFMLENQNVLFPEPGADTKKQGLRLEYFSSILYSDLFRSQLLDSLRKRLPPVDEQGKPYTPGELMRTVTGGVQLLAGDYEDMIDLTVRTNDSRLSYQAALLATELLKSRSLALEQEELQNAVDFIEKQKKNTLGQMEEVEKSIQAFKERSDITIPTEGGVIDQLNNLENQLTEIQTQKQLAMANLRAYQDKLDQLQSQIQAPVSEEPPAAGQLRRELADMESRRESAASGPGNAARMDRMDRQIGEKKKSLVSLLLRNGDKNQANGNSDAYLIQKSVLESKITEELNVNVLGSKEQYYVQKIKDFKIQHPNLSDTAIEYIRMLRSKTVLENLYNFLLQRGEESKIKAATNTGGLRLVDPPGLAAFPISVGLAQILIKALMIGLGLGFGLIWTLEHLDHSLKSGDDITQKLAVSVMGKIPSFGPGIRSVEKSIFSRLGRTSDGSLSDPAGNSQLIRDEFAQKSITEAYLTLRSNLVFANAASDVRVLVVSSPLPQEGKSVTSANLAIAFAQLGKRVILVDADFRKPMQHRLFKIRISPGLSEYIANEIPLKSVVRPGGIPNLLLIPAGRTPPNPIEILASRKMGQLIAYLRGKVHMVIFDTPPILPVSDSVVLGARSDGLLLVVRHELTSVEAAREAIEILQKSGTRILGAVLNNVLHRWTYADYRYYGKYYHTYYKQQDD